MPKKSKLEEINDAATITSTDIELALQLLQEADPEAALMARAEEPDPKQEASSEKKRP
jgi:hypothetical protein